MRNYIIIRCNRNHWILKIALIKIIRKLFYIELWDDMKKVKISFWNKKTKEINLFYF